MIYVPGSLWAALLKWLWNFLAPPDTRPSYGREADDHGAMDWNAWTITLFRLSSDAIRRFADGHPSETFHALGLDCNSETGEVLIAANTSDGLADAVSVFVDRSSFQLGEPAQGMIDPLEWNIATWKYLAINGESEEWSNEWDEAMVAIAHADDSLRASGDQTARAALHESFLCMAARVALRLLSDDVLSNLKTTGDFTILCVGRGEPAAAGFERMARLAREKPVLPPE